MNLAMLDAHDLALACAPTVDEAVRTYEATMLPRSATMAQLTADGPEGSLSADPYTLSPPAEEPEPAVH